MISYFVGARNRESVSLTPKSLIRDESGTIIAILIRGKENRLRRVKLYAQEQRDFFEKLALGKKENEKLVNLKPDSSSTGIRRALEYLSTEHPSLKKYLLARSTQHALRKNFCCRVYQAEFNRALMNGDDNVTADRKAVQETMFAAGHKKSRRSLRLVYLDNFINR